MKWSSCEGKTDRLMRRLAQYLFISAAAVLLALNYSLFIVKNNFAPAGLNGIATMLQYKTGFNISYMTLIINIPLCIVAYFVIDKLFARRSLCFCLVYSCVYLLLQRIDLSAYQYNSNGHDTIFPVILSGVLSGLVYGVCFKNRASTGGTDIISKYISKTKPELNFFYLTFAINAAVALISIFVYAKADEQQRAMYDYKPFCLCVLYCFISSFVGDYIIKGAKKASKFTVISSHGQEISDEIASKLQHSSTQAAVIGSYNKQEKSMLICVVNIHQIPDFKHILEKHGDTFCFCETVDETYGNFNKVK